jgi:hypothetical protein
MSSKDMKKQRKQIESSRRNYSKKKYVIRDKLDSFVTKPSKHIIDLKRTYPDIKNLSDLGFLSKKFNIPISGLEMIINKGRGAYYSSGSRPNQTPDSWAYARLASTLLGRKACKIDSHVLKIQMLRVIHCEKNITVVLKPRRKFINVYLPINHFRL